MIDVGSTGGLQPPWDKHEAKIKYLLNFEPNNRPVRRKHICTYNTALWECEAELPFYIYKGHSGAGSSLFQQNFEYVDAHWNQLRGQGPEPLARTWHDRSKHVRTAVLKCRKLDDVLDAEGLQDKLHFLKVDAQGAEGQILRGAERFLENQCVGLQLELFRIPLYKGIMLIQEVTELLQAHGFALVLQMPPHGSFDSQSDCIFMHRSRGAQNVRSTIFSVYNLTPC